MKKTFYWLLPFYLLSFISSAAGEEIFGCALFLVFLFNFVYDLRKYGFSTFKKLKLGKIDFPILFFGFWALLATQFIFNDRYESWETLGSIRWIFLLYGLSYLMKKYFSLNYEKYFNFLGICLIIVCAYGIIQMFTGLELVRPTNDHLARLGDYYRATGFFSISLTYAYCIGMVGFFAFSTLLVRFKNEQNFVFPAIIFFMTIAAIIASGTRGSWIALFVATIITSFVYDKKKSILVFVSSMLVAAVLSFIPTFKDRLQSITSTRNHESNSARIDLWRANLEMAKDHPLLGMGLERSRDHLPAYYEKLNVKHGLIGHAHNDILGILSGVGVVGLIMWFWFCFYFVYLAYSLFKKTNDLALQALTLGALGSQIYFFIGGLTQCNFSDNEVSHVLIFIWALLIGIQYRISNLSKENSSYKS